jgi:hypothetical protein
MRFLLFTLLIISFSSSFAQKTRTVAFYNVENLFDTIDGTNDDAEFLPAAKAQWISKRYEEKLSHIRQVLTEIGNPLIAGFVEIENANVVRDIIKNQSAFKNYGLVHYDSKDARGIDVAMIYDSCKLKLQQSGLIRFVLPGDTIPTSRDIVWAKYKLKKESFSIYDVTFTLKVKLLLRVILRTLVRHTLSVIYIYCLSLLLLSGVDFHCVMSASNSRHLFL